MIGALLAYLRDDWRITACYEWAGRDVWLLTRGSGPHFQRQHIALPDGWVKPQ